MTGKIHVSPSDLPNVKSLATTLGIKVVKETTLGREIVLEIKYKDANSIFVAGFNAGIKAMAKK